MGGRGLNKLDFQEFTWSKTHILHQNNLDINLGAPQKAMKFSSICGNQFQSWLSMVSLSCEGENEEYCILILISDFFLWL